MKKKTKPNFFFFFFFFSKKNKSLGVTGDQATPTSLLKLINVYNYQSNSFKTNYVIPNNLNPPHPHFLLVISTFTVVVFLGVSLVTLAVITALHVDALLLTVV